MPPALCFALFALQLLFSAQQESRVQDDKDQTGEKGRGTAEQAGKSRGKETGGERLRAKLPLGKPWKMWKFSMPPCAPGNGAGIMLDCKKEEKRPGPPGLG